jgi:hypothetical protein
MECEDIHAWEDDDGLAEIASLIYSYGLTIQG